MSYQGVFRRREIKYIITADKYEKLMIIIDSHMKCDKYGKSLICSLYFDTPDFLLIRNSMQKPTVYKEKLRLRSYGVPTGDTLVFAELKKKYKGIVYKRRIMLPYDAAYNWLVLGGQTSEDSQIAREIEYFREFYRELSSVVVLSYERCAYFSDEDEGLRVTFDENLRYRFHDTDLKNGADGDILLGDGFYLMEIKIPSAMPLWLSHALCELEIYPSSYSKYANAYTKLFLKKINMTKERQTV